MKFAIILVFLVLFFSFSPLCLCEEAEIVRRSEFPDGFLFGTSTSSYQIEGGYLEDGKGFNTWDVFSRLPGKIKNEENGDVADDHYHRFLEDIEIMNYLGVNSYRFSISWARILPRGRFGEVNPDGIKFYNQLIDNLLLNGIEPLVTMNHFELPQELQDRYGAWLSPSIQEDFVYYAKICFQSFGDRVKHWITINEPNLFTEMAYIRGTYPPAHCSAPFGNCSVGNSDREPLIVMHNMLLSHAKAVKLYREKFQPRQGGSIGIIAYTCMYEPLRDDEADRGAAKRAIAFQTAWVLDPVVHGDYPPEMRQCLGNQLPHFSPEHREYVRGSVDFIGMNYYSTLYAKDCCHSACNSGSDHPIKGYAYTTGERDGIPIGDRTGMNRFFVVPRGLEKMISYVKERYNEMPIIVTENGYSPPAPVNEQEMLEDTKRVDFHNTHIAALARAMRNGADVRGYFVWTLMDNFEWTSGYSVKFGLYSVDRQTLTRTPRLSAKWYRDFLADKSHLFSAVDFNRSTQREEMR